MNMSSLETAAAKWFEAQVWAKRPPVSCTIACVKLRPREGKDAPFSGPDEADETYFSGKRANMSNARRRPLKGAGCGRRGQEGGGVLHLGRASRIRHFEHTAPGAAGCTDEAAVYAGFAHERINHSEYVCGTVHPNGMEVSKKRSGALLNQRPDGVITNR
ncbi:MAG: hypothetical protein M2R45_00114 [Verrucomicrobia subdivision 3 bacterium]|nr:hypothetical protein [Limisphaerales bacterium]MCS1412426.1 hypothetical protein [Limisphaerales bacterium]